MTFLDVMHGYFRGERQIGLALVVVGLALVGFALWVWRTQSGSFATGLLVPLAIAGAGAAIGGPVLVVRTDRQVPDLQARYQADPAAMADAELARMARVNANWPRLKAGWTVLTLAALVLLMGVKRDWATGLGLALLILVAVIFTTDVFAERRALVYTAALEQLKGPRCA